MSKYRIITDKWAGYEVQIWRPWWPFWIQAGGTNTHRSTTAAEAYARQHASGRRKVVKYLGDLSGTE